ncbi:MAG: 2-C-methyl-D-erythritol 4-phosphate cytidylyltransferase [Bacteroidota bacterium]
MNRYALIVAGGTGTRMGADLPKQFLPLAGQPVLAHTLRRFTGLVERMVLVLHPDWISYWENQRLTLKGIPQHEVVAGGESRTASVRNGLHVLSDTAGLVAVHDAARPLISPDLIRLLFDEAAQKGNAIPAIPSRDSLRELTESGSRAVPREQFMAVQTPQVFGTDSLQRAFEEQQGLNFSDEAGLMEASGHVIHLVKGAESNLKITVASDLVLAEALLAGLA